MGVYHDFGDDLRAATTRAAARIEEAVAYGEGFKVRPHRGTGHPDILPGLRSVTNKGFVFYFRIDEPLGEVRILAAFFGGADHLRTMADRLQH